VLLKMFLKGLNAQLKKGLIYLAALGLVLSMAVGAKAALLGDTSDGSRAGAVHQINLVNEDGEKITPGDDPLLPFSTKQTCGDCHSYDKISNGWHFNATDPDAKAGRQGQPWIYVDVASCTQIPISYRNWPDTFTPQQIGLTNWQFTNLFGRQMPGGGVGVLDSEDDDELMRQFVSGPLEINCLICHNANHGQNQAEYADQTKRQNFRWASTAACEFASVTGSAKDMPDTYDPLMPEEFDDPKMKPPTVTYRENAFDEKNRVLLDVVREVPAERCYFCHSTATLKEGYASEKWQQEEDVHLAAGLTCVDCHRNGTDHNIIRGYQCESKSSDNPLAAVSSCKNCHLPHLSSMPTAGRLGAPEPKHTGIPAIHFKKLTCTACHSGNWPEEKTGRVKTSRAHGLGTHGVNKSNDALPHILTPVFARERDGLIGPHNLIWPAYWASVTDQNVAPLDMKIVKQTVPKIISADKLSSNGDWPELTESQITKVLVSLSSKVAAKAKPVYICGGKLYSLNDAQDKLVAAEHESAEPYLWPVSHNVRPAVQSVGVRGCSDCHDTDAPFIFGTVAVDSPLVSDVNTVRDMIDFQLMDPVYAKAFAMSFVFRPMLKVVLVLACAVLALVLLLYGLRAIRCVTRVLTGKD